MAMTKCKECGTEISTTADACPKCGAKQARTSGCAKVVLGFFGLIVFLLIVGQCSRDDSSSSSSPASETSTAAGQITRGELADRDAAIEVERCAKQYLGKPSSGPSTEIWIMCLHASSELARRNKINVARQVIRDQRINVFESGQPSNELSPQLIDRINRGD